MTQDIDKLVARELSTREVAKMLGIQPALLRKWKARGLLQLAPSGVSGQGRSIECFWSEEAVGEVRALQASRLRRQNMSAKDSEISRLRAELEAVKAERDRAVLVAADEANRADAAEAALAGKE